MREASTRLVRTWAAILVAYALLLGALAPAFAGPGAVAPPAGVICGTLPAGPADTPAPGGADHGKVCCILCTVAGPPLLPAPIVVPARRAPAVLPLVILPSRAPIAAGPPAASPGRPRAPPVAA
ncbi:hypothetical protein [Oharaeibacter diazotrophicus]|uniref:DUF2946 family protein n=1 Tax=Oharaeibacter diazotrophicus TaxID=1920512 RepID=A0A4R6RKP9_9HYPH|nr:hypothetical protein [Oharaeibacter diazotrophicus]TDP87241.1 hypothetical protein EDD54_1130 [Oharaeibacter diazotrophicus]BBE70816.1 hypothetical protein OHA_1_00383 [Pleomorphomonas sp. SM30]GLS77564.1 hypothetical protein GCM10007904_29010 [Oharaeibacter diazotrophicus]